ncbi:MAG: bifunctional diaminohydroxyphosphoribosylaminopyrimidine deaminase/5-amino-6-(5-phosphoribosylamino)uracil reductase RibD, partial [Deltaproteobacteria bacterium]|nr:bifunctional diaminohydroxyphosphoribosylaminopyrimidine deaminase/5-amino-6-(5-phosphoribosylamino)uracil reductase RibD [Deltaproteobacteria bacterium]
MKAGPGGPPFTSLLSPVITRAGRLPARRPSFNEGRARGATLYVTLEPCNHQGRTPPCTEAILQAGVSRVVVGMRDPNPGVRGGGCRFLAERGVDVLVGVLERECMRLNEAFVKFVRTGRPFVAAKSAMTLDGWTATREKHARWVTGEQS